MKKELNEDGILVIDEPAYVNGVEVSVTPLEILMDLKITDGSGEMTVSKIIMTPEFTKGLSVMLCAAVEKFEQDHGKIRDISRIFNRKGIQVPVTYSTGGGVN